MRRSTHRVAIAALAFVFIAGFGALGSWQVQRRAWKLDLIDRVDARARAPAAQAPARERWPRINAVSDEYRHVEAAGEYAADSDTFVQALTERGGGFWVLTPLKLADGSMVLVNRGFVPPELRERVARITGPTRVFGLLRLTEPGGGFLRRNEPSTNRWFSRDVPAIATARGLANVAPYFIDADAGTAEVNAPIGGLTVIAFSNNHLVYAITWYTLALMAAAGGWRLMREEQRAEHA